MRFKVLAAVESRCRVEQPVTLDDDGVLVGLWPDSEGILDTISLSMKVIDYERYLPEVRPNPGGTHYIRFLGGPFADQLVELLQHMESLGGFWLAIRKVHWEEAEMRWVPEGEEEAERLDMTSFSQSYSFPDPPRPFDIEMLRQTLRDREERSYLVIPFAFLREGLVEHGQLRFIQAFFNFYFFLEGLYGSGKTRNYQVEKEFARSVHLRQAIPKALDQVRGARGPRQHFEHLSYMLKERQLSTDAIGIVKLLVRMRGTLHHFTPKGTKFKGHPLNQYQFEALSFLSMAICMNVVPLLMRGEAPR